ncbi:MAG: MFS transporter, partial [Flavobacteriaceae bacterium]
MIASGGRGRRARISWALFDWAAQPLYTLLLTFIFGPYFVARVAADAVQGQSLWGAANAAAGIGIAVASPLLGAIADRGGNRKGWIALFSLAAVAGSALLWLAEPQAPGAVVWLVLAAFVVAALGVEYATVFTNSMLPDLAGPGKVGSLSGLGWGVGYVGGLVSLAIMLCFLVTDPQTGRTLAGLEPPSFLAGIPFAGDRASGPFSALWYLVFVLPLFLFVPEARPQAGGGGVSLRRSFADLVASLKSYGRGSPFLRFLVARMIYADGLGALFAFGGVYAATTFGWGATELGLFGILLTFTGAIGAVAGGRADDRYGPRAVVVATLAALFALAIAAFSTTRD